MNEELEKALCSIQKSIEAWEEEKSHKTAAQLEMQLSLLKLLVGIEKFDELPAFARVLREVSTYLNREYERQMKEDCNGK